VRRRRGNYLAARTAAGEVLLITTVPVGGGCPSTTAETAEAVEAFAAALADLCDTHLPIMTSRAWKLPVDDFTIGKWRRRGSAPPGTYDDVAVKLGRDSMKPERQVTCYGERTLFEMPSDWNELQIECYFEDLSSLEGDPENG
jgi:hypothetical protein